MEEAHVVFKDGESEADFPILSVSLNLCKHMVYNY